MDIKLSDGSKITPQGSGNFLVIFVTLQKNHMSRFQQNVKICPFRTPLLAVLLKFAVILTILWLIMQFQNQLYLLHINKTAREMF